MPTLFLHMGAGKTGTSALQVAFAQNIAELRKRGILYPADASTDKAKLGKITSGNGFNLARYLDSKRYAVEQADLDSISRAFDKALMSKENVLYSSEFFEPFTVARLRDLIERSARSGYKTKIVYYVRSIAGHAASVYSLTVKRQKSELSFEEFLKEKYRNPFLSFIERANLAAGRENVLIYNFDSVRTNLFAHFLQKVLGVDIKNASFTYPKNVNRSLNAFEVELMRYLNARFEKPHQAAFASDALIYGDDTVQPDFTITPMELDLLRSQYGTVVDLLNEHIIGDKILFCDSSVVEGERPQIQLTEFERSILSIVARLIPNAPSRDESTLIKTLKRMVPRALL